jgi:hypothetical protein
MSKDKDCKRDCYHDNRPCSCAEKKEEEKKKKDIIKLDVREWLNEKSDYGDSFVIAKVSRDDDASWDHVDTHLTIGDCNRRIQLEFDAYNEESYKNSLKKINILTDTLIKFRDTFEKEGRISLDNRKDEKKKDQDDLDDILSESRLEVRIARLQQLLEKWSKHNERQQSDKKGDSGESTTGSEEKNKGEGRTDES